VDGLVRQAGELLLEQLACLVMQQHAVVAAVMTQLFQTAAAMAVMVDEVKTEEKACVRTCCTA
jgi:hypothetical protein